MTSKIFNVFLGGTGEKLGVQSDYEVAEAICALLKPKDGVEYVDYVFYNGVDTQGDNHRYPITPTPNALGNVGAVLLGEGSDNIRDSVLALVEGKVEPTRLMGMLEPKASHTTKSNPIILRNKSEDELLSLEHHLNLSPQEIKQVDALIQAIRNKEINQVNLVGWSRGGVNAIRIANALYNYNPKIAVNIIDFDPVPGPTNHTPPTQVLSPNVKNYLAFIAENEYRLGFIPVIPDILNPDRTRREIYTVPGNHDSLMGVRGIPHENQLLSSPLARRVYAFAHQKLLEWGATTVPLEDQSQAGQDWKVIYENRATYAKPVTNSIVSNEIQILNYKISKDRQGKEIHYRMIQDKNLGYRYMDSVDDFRFNPASEWDNAFFGLASEVCTLQRDYNDRKIAEAISSDQFTLAHVKNPFQVFKYLIDRYQVVGAKSPLKPAIEKLQKDLSVDDIFLAALLNHDKAFARFSTQMDKINEEGWTPLMIAARYGSEAVISQLLRLHCNVNLTNTEGENALDIAARHGQVFALKSMLASFSAEQQINALITAAKHQQHVAVDNLAQWIDLTHPYLLANAEVDYLRIWAVEQERIKLLIRVVDNTHLTVHFPMAAHGNNLRKHAEVMKKSKVTDQIGHSTARSTGKPFFTTARTLTTVGCVGALGYASTVLAMSLAQVNYNAVVESIFVATSMGSNAALAALFLTVGVIFAVAMMARFYNQDNQVAPLSLVPRYV